MTSTVVRTYLSNTTEDLPNSGDLLLETSSGSIVSTNGAYGIYATNSYQQIIVDGFIYSAEANVITGFGVYLGSTTGTTLVVNGEIQAGFAGVNSFEGSSEYVEVGSQGTIDGMGGGVAFNGNASSPGATFDSLSNAGDISSAQGDAVFLSCGGDDSIVNSGDISGYDSGIRIASNADTDNIANSGTIAGGIGEGIWSQSSSAGVDIVNSGLITNSGENRADSYGTFAFDDNSGTTSTIDNEGTISGLGYAIQSLSDILDISNSGTIHGGLYSTSSVDIDNSGLWQAAADGDGLLTTGSGSQLTNTGTINAAISIEAGNHTFVTNSGKIDGSVVFAGSGSLSLLDNSGSILSSDPVSLDAVEFEGSSATLDNSAGGVIAGPVAFSGSGDTLDNAGAISGAISLLGGADHISNSGSISGSFGFTGSSGGDIVVNSGSIGEGISFQAASETLTNTATGSIAGPALNTDAVIFSAIDGTLRNGGKIDGGVSLDDTSTLVNSGSITGAIAIVGLNDRLRNSGTIADSITISGAAGSTGDDIVTNSGSMANGISFALVGESLTNASKGSITGAVYFAGDASELQNGGTIDGAVNMANESTLVNSGSINGAVGIASGADTLHNTGSISGAVALTGSGSDDVVTDAGSMEGGITFGSGKEEALSITGTGSIGSVSLTTAAIAFGGSEANLKNGGTIGGAVDLTSGHDTVVNSGTVDGNVVFQQGATGADGGDSTTNSGSISGELMFENSAGTETATNDAAGTITGGVDLGSHGENLVNSGKIDGGVFSAGSTASGAVTNAGTIDGGIALLGTQNLTNDGQINGNVSLGANSTMTNAGVIDGSLTIGASDTVNLSPGAITGTISASTSDLLEFSGNFGNETIYNFLGGTTSNDTIQFATNDFASFTALQKSMTQVGSDVLIKHDATDSITLVGVTLTSLVSADFKFV